MIVIAAATLHAQPTNGAVYWSTDPNLDCSALGESPATITNSSGTTIGYSCYVTGTFVWLATGGIWGTSIRVAAPASNPIGVDYSIYAQDGTNLSLDYNMGSGTSTASGNDITFALKANQPAVVNLLGAAGGAPSYSAPESGSVYVHIFCPDATTCLNATPQLIYSSLPTYPWSLSVPIAWDDFVFTQWSAEAIDDGQQHVVSLVIYNETPNSSTYKIDIFDSTGKQVASYTTPSINGFNSSTGEGGTYAVLLRDVIPNLPSGIFKVLVDGGSNYSAGEVLQITGASATTLQVAPDTGPSAALIGAVVRSRDSVRRLRGSPAPRAAFRPIG